MSSGDVLAIGVHPPAPPVPNQYLAWVSGGDPACQLLAAADVAAAYADLDAGLPLPFDRLAQVVVNGSGDSLRASLCHVVSKGVRDGGDGARYADYAVVGFGTVGELDRFSVRVSR